MCKYLREILGQNPICSLQWFLDQFIEKKVWKSHATIFFFNKTELVHWRFIHVCFVQVTSCGAPDALTRLGACNFLFISHLHGLRKYYYILEKCAHRGGSARRKRQTMFKIVTWSKQTWIIHQCTTEGVDSCETVPLKAKKDGYLRASPWSPPSWWATPASCTPCCWYSRLMGDILYVYTSPLNLITLH